MLLYLLYLYTTICIMCLYMILIIKLLVNSKMLLIVSGTVMLQFSCSVCATLCDPMNCSTPGFPVHQGSEGSITNSRHLLKLLSFGLVMPSNHLILCHPLFLLPSISPSIRIFSSESTLCIRWPKTGASASASVLPVADFPED